MSTPLKVCFALGLGDTYWACTKLKALQEATGRPLHGYINSSEHHQSVNLLRLVPYLEQCFQAPDAPYDVFREFSPTYTDPRWSTREGCAGWRGYDYVMVPNGHLERGEPLATWWPDLETEYNIALNIPAYVRDNTWSWVGKRRPVLLYVSGTGPNNAFHGGTFNERYWAQVIEGLNAHNIAPTLVGARTRDDTQFASEVRRWAGGAAYDDLVGQTSTEEYLALIEHAAVWIGLNSGGGIIAASRGTPTVMLWSDSQYPIHGLPPHLPLHTNMKSSWLPPEASAWYRTLSFGSPALTPQAVVEAALEVMRA